MKINSWITKIGLILTLPLLLIITTTFLSTCNVSRSDKIQITNAKIATGVDDNLMPVKITSVFPKGTTDVFCWLRWKNAQINTSLIASWHYVTDDIHILDYTFTIPRKEGTGSVSLIMPRGKNLPSGDYKLTLKVDNCVLKTLTFKVTE